MAFFFTNPSFEQDCATPCTRLDIVGKLQRTAPSTGESWIRLIFEPQVEVTRSVRTMTGFTLVSNIGGILGLLLGMGVLQILEIIDHWLRCLIFCC